MRDRKQILKKKNLHKTSPSDQHIHRIAFLDYYPSKMLAFLLVFHKSTRALLSTFQAKPKQASGIFRALCLCLMSDCSSRVIKAQFFQNDLSCPRSITHVACTRLFPSKIDGNKRNCIKNQRNRRTGSQLPKKKR